MSEGALQLRLGLAGAAAVLPWAWLGLLALWRRKPQTQARYVRLANRSVAVATLVLALEGLLLALTLRVGAYEKLARWDALFLLVPLYAFAVWLLMLSRFDQGGQLVALRLLRSWGKWGGIALSALTVVNVGVWVFWGPLFQFVAPPSVALVGILAAVFLVKLWRTGDLAPAEQPDPNAGQAPKAEPPKADPKQAPKADAKQPPKAEPPKADAKQPPKAEPPKAAPSPAPSSKAEPSKAAPSNIPDDFDDLPPLKPSALQPSSAQPDSPSSPQGAAQGDARDELYRLLAAQEEDEQ
jgi:hypothetical protein